MSASLWKEKAQEVILGIPTLHDSRVRSVIANIGIIITLTINSAQSYQRREYMDPIILIIILALVGYALASVKMVNQGNVALVERLGRYHCKLNPGPHMIIPIIDQIVMEDTTREQLLDIKPQNVITKDGIYLEIDAILYWRIKDIEKSFYAIDDLQQALTNLATTNLRENIAHNSLEYV
jgi:regulator of protease activity HflC (stomatin/prohibitin superfamily)